MKKYRKKTLKYTPVINFPVLDDVCVEAGRRGQVLPPLLLLFQDVHRPSLLLLHQYIVHLLLLLPFQCEGGFYGHVMTGNLSELLLNINAVRIHFI